MELTTFSIWCWNAALAFSLVTRSTRTVVLMSGTLTPIDCFSKELSCPFPHSLITNHVILPSQVRF